MANTITRIGTPSNLPTGATYDILFLGFVDGFPQGQLKFEFGDTPRKTTGIQKVAQIFLKILLTSRGSDVLYPNRGTNFSQLTVNANIQDDDSVFSSELLQEIKSAESQTKYVLNTYGTDLASQLREINVLSIDTSTEAVTLYIRIVTAAGESAAVAIPFPQLDMVING